jgi:excisionase family DNA binding protein
MTTFLTLKKGDELRQIQALLDSDLKAVKNAEGNVVFTQEERDKGSQIMTVADLSALLQVPVATIRQMTKTRSQLGPHPLPFHKVNGKMLRFDRAKIMRWLETTPARIRPKKRKSVRG